MEATPVQPEGSGIHDTIHWPIHNGCAPWHDDRSIQEAATGASGHHHDGFLNVNGIFEGRFDIILTNPPFGANVGPSDVVLEERTAVSDELERKYTAEFGDLYLQAQARIRAAAGNPIATLLDLPKGNGTARERHWRAKSTKSISSGP